MDARLPPLIPTFLFLSLYFFNGRRAAEASVPLGSTLRPPSPADRKPATAWSSTDKTFILTFLLDTTHPSFYLPTITYTGSSIPLWIPAPNAAVSSSGSLTLDATGDLRLFNGSTSLVWHSSTSNLGVSFAVLEDTGNLRLVASDNISTIWQSFDHPTDTLLATQNFTIGQKLFSGDYMFVLTNSANLTLKWNNAILYYNKFFYYNKDTSFSTSTSNKTFPFLTLTLEPIGTLVLAGSSGSVVVAYSSDYAESGSLLRFLRLDPDGNLRAYSYLAGSSSPPAQQWAAVDDHCRVFAYCGSFGICTYNNASSPSCMCPSPDFSPVDPSNARMGCRRRRELTTCPGNITLVRLDHTQFLTYPPELSTEQFFVEISGCQTDCDADRTCVASTALSDASGICYLKQSSVLSGYQSAAQPSTSFVKVCFPAMVAEQTPAVIAGGTEGSSKLGVRFIALVVVGGFCLAVVIEFLIWWIFALY